MGDIVGSVFGGSSAANTTKKFKPVGFDAGGLTASFTGGKKKSAIITPSAERLGQVTSLADVFGQRAKEIGALEALVKPGMSEFRSSRLNQIESDRMRTIGNLSDNLARRRVSGSSFGVDALARANREFSDQKDRVVAETALQELALTQQLIKERTQAQAEQYNTYLNELNLEANAAVQLSTQATSVLGQNAAVAAQIQQQAVATGWDVVSGIFDIGMTLGGVT